MTDTMDLREVQPPPTCMDCSHALRFLWMHPKSVSQFKQRFVRVLCRPSHEHSVMCCFYNSNTLFLSLVSTLPFPTTV